MTILHLDDWAAYALRVAIDNYLLGGDHTDARLADATKHGVYLASLALRDAMAESFDRETTA